MYDKKFKQSKLFEVDALRKNTDAITDKMDKQAIQRWFPSFGKTVSNIPE